MDSAFNRIAVIGAGPVGTITAAFLARAGTSVFLTDVRLDRIQAVRERGLRVEGKADHFTVRPAAAETSKADLPAFRPDWVFLSVKSFSLTSVLDELTGLIDPGAKILILQNGLDNEEAAAQRLGRDRVFRAVINFAGMLREPGVVHVSFFNPPNYVGALTPDGAPVARRLAEVLTLAGMETRSVPDIKRYEWIKTILAAALMPVCGPTGLTMKEARDLPETRSLCERILRESIAVASRLGYDFGAGFFSECLDYLANTDNHKPSSSVDLEAGLPVEYVFQPIIDWGRTVQSPTPCLETLTLVMRALEKRRN
jgi:2-dehydropantoate 2-reductase